MAAIYIYFQTPRCCLSGGPVVACSEYVCCLSGGPVVASSEYVCCLSGGPVVASSAVQLDTPLGPVVMGEVSPLSNNYNQAEPQNDDPSTEDCFCPKKGITLTRHFSTRFNRIKQMNNRLSH